MTRTALPSTALLALAAACSGCSRPAPDAVPAEHLASPAARARGRQLFLTHCALCHGLAANGRGARQRYLIGRPPDFTSKAWRRRATATRVLDTIRDGKPATSMPAWRHLDRDHIFDLTVYVLSASRRE